MERKHVYEVLDDGTKVCYDVILTFHNDDYDKDYIVYTDNTYDEDDKLRIYASVYDSYNNTFIGSVDTDEEWDTINRLLKEVLE